MATSRPTRRWCSRASSERTRWCLPSGSAPLLRGASSRPATTAARGLRSRPQNRGSSISGWPPRFGTRSSAPSCAPAPPSEIRRLAAASASMSSSFRRTPPGRCMSGTAAVRSSGMRSRDCSPKRGSRSSASITSTTPAPRSISSRDPPICGTARHWRKRLDPSPKGFIPENTSSKPAARWPSAMDANGSAGPKQRGLGPIRDFAVERMMALIRAVLAALGVNHDRFVSERDLVEKGAIGECLASLEQRGLIYTGVLEAPKGKLPDDWEAREQTLFRATRFCDDIDRPLSNSDGSWTYFSADIAYHRDKFRRGFNNLIDVWGADHSGYVKRMQAAVRAVTDGVAALDVKICQLVNLSDRGVPVRMSKRAGTFITLREVVDEVGKDVFRFIMLTRKNDQALDFDFAKVTEQSKDNPVFYVQYAHARAASVMRHAAEQFPEDDLSDAALAGASLDRLCDPAELALIREIAGWPRVVESAAEAHEPHSIAFYLQEVAALFHTLWNKGKDEAT